jgi:hypothetical protein
LLVACSLGCAKFQTARECGVFASAIKSWKQPKGVSSAAPAVGVAAALDSRTLADRYDELAQSVDALHLKSAELAPRAQRYQKLARGAAAALRDVAAAVEKGDADGARKRRVEFDDIARGEAPLVAEINAVCR